jgi:short-subunit dehydrogenase
MATALITGASSGIGYELAKVLAKNGHDLVLVARRLEKLNELKTEIETKYQVQVDVLGLDLSVLGAAEKVKAYTQERNVSIDYLVNNAGFGDYGLFQENDWKKQEDMIVLNINALTHLTRVFLTEMSSRNSGKILNVASTAAFQPGPFMSVYFATKAYVLSFSEALRAELMGTNISVTTLCPGPTQSEFQSAAGIQGVELFDNSKTPSSAALALFGYQAMMKNKGVVIHGFTNKLTVFLNRVLPRTIILKAIRKAMSKVKMNNL